MTGAGLKLRRLSNYDTANPIIPVSVYGITVTQAASLRTMANHNM